MHGPRQNLPGNILRGLFHGPGGIPVEKAAEQSIALSARRPSATKYQSRQDFRILYGEAYTHYYVYDEHCRSSTTRKHTHTHRHISSPDIVSLCQTEQEQTECSLARLFECLPRAADETSQPIGIYLEENALNRSNLA